MANKANDSKVSLSQNIISSVFCTLKIPNFFTLPEYADGGFNIESPSFEFVNETWRFRFFSQERDESYKSFSINMIRETSTELPYDMILYAATLQNAIDEDYICQNDTCFLGKDCKTCELGSPFENSEPYYDMRDIMTLFIHLVPSGSTEWDAYPISSSTGRDVDVLSQDIKKLFMSKKNHDLVLRVADKEFQAHRGILMARSTVFDAMLNVDMKEKQKGVIDVPDCDPEVMEQFLFYVYSGKVEMLSSDNALGLYYVADKYNMVLLKVKCAEFIKNSLSPSIICDVLQLALNHSDTDLLECATEFFLNHERAILSTVGWLWFMKSNTIVANELLIKAFNKWHCKK